MRASLRAVVLIAALLLGVPASAGALEFPEFPGSPFPTTEAHYEPQGGFLIGGAAVGDFNGDGVDDIALSNATGVPAFSSGESVTILLGHRDGPFTMAPGSPVGLYSGGIFASNGAVATADFNGDGKLDLAVVDNIHDTVYILLGDGTGGFRPYGVPISLPIEVDSIAVGDFTGNGIEDLAFAGGEKVYVLLGNGAGGFTPAPGSPFMVPGHVRSLTSGDFNSDGRSDLAVTLTSQQVAIYLARADGSFEVAAPPVRDGGSGDSIVASDLTGNGKLDLAIANAEPGDVAVLLGDGAGHFALTPQSPFPVPGGTESSPGLPSSIVAGDFEGNGIQDLAVANFNGSSDDIAVFLGDGRGGFAPAPGPLIPAHANPKPLLVGDFNGDGRPDLAAVNSDEGYVTVLENTSDLGGPTTGETKPGPPVEPPAPGGGEIQPTRAAIRALIVAQLRSIGAWVRHRSALASGAASVDLQGPEAGVATVECYAAQRGLASSRGRPVLLATGASTFTAAASRKIELHLTRVGRRLWRRDRDLRLTIRETFFPAGGQQPVSPVRTLTVSRH